MASKSGPPPSSYDEDNVRDELPPPTYAEAQHTGQSSNSTTFTPPSDDKKSSSHLLQPQANTSHSTQIQHQLSLLTSTITSTQTQRSLLTTAHDTKILTLLTHEIQHYLSDFAISGRQKGTLILVPAAGITDPTALPVDFISSNSTEFTRFARVVDDEGQKKIEEREKASEKARERYGYGYDHEAENNDRDGGEDLWFWDDEAMARRLAASLRPVGESKRQESSSSSSKAPPVGKKQEGGSSLKGLWGRKKKEVVAAVVDVVTGVAASNEPQSASTLIQKKEDRVIMDVKAEEVSFRFENECGLLESKTGFGIVVRLRVIFAV